MSQFSRQVKRAITDLGVSVAVFRIACVAGVRKGRGRGRELGRETTREGGGRGEEGNACKETIVFAIPPTN